jgi:type II pantothenate kinase
MVRTRPENAQERAAQAPREDRAAVGVDLGATLAKLAIERAGSPPALETLPARAIAELARRVEAAGAARVGLTGGGAPELAAALACESVAVGEFEAWARGARRLLRGEAAREAGARYLLVSLGTGCSALLVEESGVRRVGGTALGGGTALALGAALAGARSFEELCALARRGDRRRVDLCVADIYRSSPPPLPGDVSAASLAKLGLPGGAGADPSDLAHAIMGLVGENAALLCGYLAAAAGVGCVVYGGSTLVDNPALVDVLRLVTAAAGRRALFLEHGAHAGALGALELAQGS